MDEQEKPLSLVLFSGTDDKLNAAAVLTVGAAVMGRPVNIFLQYYALRAFRAGKVCADHALAWEATDALTHVIHAHPGQHWSELLKQKHPEVGHEVSRHAIVRVIEQDFHRLFRSISVTTKFKKNLR